MVLLSSFNLYDAVFISAGGLSYTVTFVSWSVLERLLVYSPLQCLLVLQAIWPSQSAYLYCAIALQYVKYCLCIKLQCCCIFLWDVVSWNIFFSLTTLWNDIKYILVLKLFEQPLWIESPHPHRNILSLSIYASKKYVYHYFRWYSFVFKERIFEDVPRGDFMVCRIKLVVSTIGEYLIAYQHIIKTLSVCLLVT